MRNLRTGRFSRKTLAALAVAGSLALQPLGGQAAVTGIVKGKLQLGNPIGLYRPCQFHAVSCALFTGNIVNLTANNSPDPCFNQDPDRRRDIFGTKYPGDGTSPTDPTGSDPTAPEELSWGGKWPFLNVKDIAKYNTTSPSRFAKFTLKPESQGHVALGQHRLNAEMRSVSCQSLGNLGLDIAKGETKTIPIPRGTKWFLLYAGSTYTAGDQEINRDQIWTLAFD